MKESDEIVGEITPEYLAMRKKNCTEEIRNLQNRVGELSIQRKQFAIQLEKLEKQIRDERQIIIYYPCKDMYGETGMNNNLRIKYSEGELKRLIVDLVDLELNFGVTHKGDHNILLSISG